MAQIIILIKPVSNRIDPPGITTQIVLISKAKIGAPKLKLVWLENKENPFLRSLLKSLEEEEITKSHKKKKIDEDE